MKGFSSSRLFLFLPAWAVKPDFGGFSACRRPDARSILAKLRPEWAVSAKHVAMQQVARETWVAFEGRLERARVPAAQRPDYHKWIRFYLDFCHKYGHPPRSPTSLGAPVAPWSNWISVADRKRGFERVLWYQGMSRVCPGCPQTTPRELRRASCIRRAYGERPTTTLQHPSSNPDEEGGAESWETYGSLTGHSPESR